MNWLILIVAGLFEVVWATALKMSNGFRNPLADVVCAVGMIYDANNDPSLAEERMMWSGRSNPPRRKALIVPKK